MSQEPMADDVPKGTEDTSHTPLEEVRETVHDEGDSRLEEDVLEAVDMEEVESVASKEPLDVFTQTEADRSPSEATPSSPNEIIDALRRVREDVGQICELSSEEGKIVEAFSLALFKLMHPLAKAIPVDPSVLPREMGEIEGANIVPSGGLIVLHRDGRMESIALSDEANRDLLVGVIRDVMPKFNRLIAERRAKIERRMDFLASVTRELQNIADAFASAIG